MSISPKESRAVRIERERKERAKRLELGTSMDRIWAQYDREQRDTRSNLETRSNDSDNIQRL
jgi:hypothetical protein